METPVQSIILEQYKTYNASKEAYIDRNFATNRFYTTLCFVLLLTALLVHLLIPDPKIMMGVCTLGSFTSLLWWLNADAYNTLIKIKYARVLEVLEQSLPKQPFREEFSELANNRVDKKTFVFPDVQKIFALLILAFFAIIFAIHLGILILRSTAQTVGS